MAGVYELNRGEQWGRRPGKRDGIPIKLFTVPSGGSLRQDSRAAKYIEILAA